MDRKTSPFGRAPRDPAELADELSERRSRALEEPLDLRLRQRAPYPIVEVRNPLHRTAYLVMFPAFPDREPALCTCTDFARRGLGTCKHIEAADRWLRAHPNTPASSSPRPTVRPTAVWREVDRRLGRAPPHGGRPMARSVREAGAALFENEA